MSSMDKLKEIGRLIKTQDNRITDAPIFIVQQIKRTWGLDCDYSDNYVWMETDSGDYSEADPEKADELNNLVDILEETPGWERSYYQDDWEFVTACFTESGCQDFINRNGHNLQSPRIYAEGSYRNEDRITFREFLIGLNGFDEQSDD